MQHKKERQSRTGRPSVMTKDVLQKLEYAFALDCTDEEACLYADIAPSTLYNFQKENPDFLERKRVLRQAPVLLAREKVVRGIKIDSRLAFDYLKAKKRDEFADRKELTGKDGQPIQVQTLADLVVGAAQADDPNTRPDQTGASDLEN